MVNKFRELDIIYNSNLFSKHPLEQWEEYGGATAEVIDILRGKKSYYEYDFKVMPADILGSVYENYLGYKLSTIKSKSKNLFGKKEESVIVSKDAKKRKDQGIYYTPSYVVDYIVRNTLKPVLNKCTSISDLKKIKVLDPACGSGSFLIKALEVINEKYKQFGNVGNQYTKFQILLENIYGVDLDSQAVEIARLNLLINSLDSREKMPGLDKNIKNGNSLTINWQDQFSDVFNQGGFDVIIGNPPYIKEFVNKEAFNDLHNSPYYQGKMDLWTLFSCISIDLLKKDGVMGFIAPNNWVTNAGASIFRDKILKDGELKTFIDFSDYKVFEQAGIQTMIFIYEKMTPREKYQIDYLRINDKNTAEDELISKLMADKVKIEVEPSKLIGKNITFSNSESGSIFDKVEKKKNFELTDKEVAQGIVADPDKSFMFSEDENFSDSEQKRLRKYFTSVGKYCSGEQRGLIAYLNKSEDYNIEELLNIKKHLLEYRKELDNRREVKNGRINWFNLHWPRDEKFFTKGPKIIGAIRTKEPGFFYTEDEYYGSRALNFIKTDRVVLKYLTSILNSRISFFWLKNKGKQLGNLLQVDKGPLMNIPICVGNKNQQKIVIDLVDKMLFLNKNLKEVAENSNEWEKIKSEIEITDNRIDQEVYKIYDLSEDEIKIVEENTK